MEQLLNSDGTPSFTNISNLRTNFEESFARKQLGATMKSIVIKDDSGRQVSSGVESTGYILSDSYQGIHTWTIVATDNVNHISSKTVTTKFDKNGPHCSSLIARPNSWSRKLHNFCACKYYCRQK